RILIVKENETARTVLRSYCESWGMAVVDTPSAEQALALVRDSERFDAALIDCASPNLDGAKLAKDIHAIDSSGQIQILMLAAHGPAQTAARAMGEFIRGVLAKPVHQSHLYDALAAAL